MFAFNIPLLSSILFLSSKFSIYARYKKYASDPPASTSLTMFSIGVVLWDIPSISSSYWTELFSDRLGFLKIIGILAYRLGFLGNIKGLNSFSLWVLINIKSWSWLWSIPGILRSDSFVFLKAVSLFWVLLARVTMLALLLRRTESWLSSGLGVYLFWPER